MGALNVLNSCQMYSGSIELNAPLISSASAEVVCPCNKDFSISMISAVTASTTDLPLRKPNWKSGSYSPFSERNSNLSCKIRSKSLDIHEVNDMGLKPPLFFGINFTRVFLQVSGNTPSANIWFNTLNMNSCTVDVNLVRISYEISSKPGEDLVLQFDKAV